MGRRANTTTIAEVAQHAGVSPATVSRVMNGNFKGDPAVAERVRASADALEYAPSPLARSLALGTTRTVGFVVPDLANPAFHAVLSGLTRAAAREGYRVLVADSAESADDEADLAIDVRRRCDSLVLCAPRMSEGALREVCAHAHPVVLINRAIDGADVPAVAVDYAAGMRALAEHLYDLGHRDMLYLEGPAASVSHAARVAALDGILRDHPDLRVQRMPAGASIADGQAVAARVAATGVTAVMAFNDLVAIGLIHGLREHGRDVPGDISVTGFDDIPFAAMTVPALTTASVPHGDLGVRAWERLVALADRRPAMPSARVEPRLERRASSATPPEGTATR